MALVEVDLEEGRLDENVDCGPWLQILERLDKLIISVCEFFHEIDVTLQESGAMVDVVGAEHEYDRVRLGFQCLLVITRLMV